MSDKEKPADIEAKGLKGRGKKALIIGMLGMTGLALSLYRLLKMCTCRKRKEPDQLDKILGPE